MEHGRVGHANGLNEEQIAVPLYLHGEGLGALRPVPTQHEEFARWIFEAATGDREPWAEYPTPDEFGLTIAGWDEFLCVRQGSWKLQLRADEAFGSYIPFALHDLETDPAEKVNRLDGEKDRVLAIMTALAELRAAIPLEGEGAGIGALDPAMLEQMGYVD